MIVKTYVLTIISLLHFSCSSVLKSHTKNKLNLIKVTSKIQMVDKEKGKLINLIDSFFIFYYENLILYRIPEIIEFSKFTSDSNNNIINQKFIRAETRYSYCIFKKGESTGLLYDSLTSKNFSQFSTDSLLEEKTIFKQGISMEPYNIVESVTLNNDSVIFEKYIPKIKKDETFPDSSYLYFNKEFNKIGFSFSRKLDSLKGMKLYKFKIIYNPIPKEIYAFNVPRRELVFEFSEETVFNPKEVVDFFESYKKRISTLK